MAFSEPLARRVRASLDARAGCVEKRMFGGVAFLLRGHMCVGVWKDNLIARIGPEAYPQALAKPDIEPFAPAGRPMLGWVLVPLSALPFPSDVDAWIEQSLSFVETLPPK